MTDKLREAAQQALEVLEQLQGGCADSDDGTVEVITVWCPEVVEALRAALAQQDAQAVSQGWKLLPVEPTPEMCNPSGDVGIVAEMAARYRREIWESMLNAAPTPPAQAATCKQDLQVDALLDEMLDTLPYNSPDYWIGRIREVRYGAPFRRNNHD